MPVSLSLDINLPTCFTLDRIDDYISSLLSFLTSPLVESLILAHPNEIAVQDEWSLDWWTWAGNIDAINRQIIIDSLIESATGKEIAPEITLHPSLASLLNDVSRLRLPRDIHSSLDTPSPPLMGMSPKKAHEIDKLCTLISRTFSDTKLIVDVGAGQGYLSRRLAELDPQARVLALDGDESQTEGAALRGQGLSHARRQQARKDTGAATPTKQVEQAVTHRTLFITSDSLSRAVDEWIHDVETEGGRDVLITGLHACGSLTPAVLKCFVDLAKAKTGTWRPSALALVGCCYNLMHDPSDFPLSQITSTTPTKLNLTPNHLQLAAQCPAQWTSTHAERERAALARRKIVWRALLARLFSASGVQPGTRLGRLPDRAYTSWETFVGVACGKMAVGVPPNESGEDTEGNLAFRLEMLHVLRALIGPVIESLIVVDRAVYLAEELGGHSMVRAINIFDQLNSGSPRNIALVVELRS
ncbi:methyltransferase domain protein [Ceratobasidium sp. AG-Ba]|nr:methyltransferase domain protein [Ceratobasidium sp. AG-Ba]